MRAKRQQIDIDDAERAYTISEFCAATLTACRALSQPVVVFGRITRFLGWGLRSGKRLCMVAVRKWTGLGSLS